jgi:hypothetical protein
MKSYLTISLALALFPAVRSSHAAPSPRARLSDQGAVVWTNEDLEKLRGLGLISIVGQALEETEANVAAPSPYVRTKDPQWYPEQASKLRAELESTESELQRYRQAVSNADSLQAMTGGINLEYGDLGITPEAGIEFLQQRQSEIQSQLDALEELARHNDIAPGILRGQ